MNGDRMSGHCSMAHLAEDEQVTLRVSVADAHARCPQAHIQANGTVWSCACECHVGTPHCPRCGKVGVDPGAHTDEECAEVIFAELGWRDNHLVRHDAAGAVRKAVGRDVGVEAPGPAPRPKKSPPEAGKNPCACGCGGTTGGTFCMGHDARLKSHLRRAVNGGTDSEGVEALAELITRNWTKTAGNLQADPSLWERAEEIVAHPKAAEWLDRRVRERTSVEQ